MWSTKSLFGTRRRRVCVSPSKPCTTVGLNHFTNSSWGISSFIVKRQFCHFVFWFVCIACVISNNWHLPTHRPAENVGLQLFAKYPHSLLLKTNLSLPFSYTATGRKRKRKLSPLLNRVDFGLFLLQIWKIKWEKKILFRLFLYIIFILKSNLNNITILDDKEFIY